MGGRTTLCCWRLRRLLLCLVTDRFRSLNADNGLLQGCNAVPARLLGALNGQHGLIISICSTLASIFELHGETNIVRQIVAAMRHSPAEHSSWSSLQSLI